MAAAGPQFLVQTAGEEGLSSWPWGEGGGQTHLPGPLGSQGAAPGHHIMLIHRDPLPASWEPSSHPRGRHTGAGKCVFPQVWA